MFGKIIETYRSKLLLGAALAAGLYLTPVARGQVLYTTTSDFTGWSTGNSTSVEPTTAFDYDSSTINGLGNNPNNNGNPLGAGGTSTGGALEIDGASTSWDPIAWSPGEGYNQAFMSAIDPGSIAAYSAGSGYGPGSLTAYSGTMYFVYTVPTFSAGGPGNGGYYQTIIGANYNGFWGPLSYPPGGVIVTPETDEGGYTTYLETVPYSIAANAGGLTYFQLAIWINEDGSAVPSSPIYVDDISLSYPVQAVIPEPASLGALGVGLMMLALRRRHHA